MNESFTKKSILELPVGQDLDVLIHQRVFGKEVHWMHNCAFTDEIGLLGLNVVPKYSSDWRYVENLVEKINSSQNRMLNPFKLSQTLKGYCCRIRTGLDRHVMAIASTIPHAVCLALLLTTLGD